jgi:hypothetical protein
MTDLNFFFEVLSHTPGWVWAVLASLLVAGALQMRPRTIGLARATALPLALMALSLAGVATVFGTPASFGAWAVGALVSAAIVSRGGAQRGARWSATDRVFHLPGSALPLVLMLGIFCTRFAVGASVAIHPGLVHVPAFAAAACLAYGAFSGVFGARVWLLWRLSRQTLRLGAA